MKSKILKLALIASCLLVSTQLLADKNRIYFINESQTAVYLDIYYKDKDSNGNWPADSTKTSEYMPINRNYELDFDPNTRQIVSTAWTDRCSVQALYKKADIVSGAPQYVGGLTLWPHVHKQLTGHYCDFLSN